MDEDDILAEIYRKKIKVEEDPQKTEQIKRIIREEIWPETKFSDMKVIEDINLNEEGTLLDIILTSLNEEGMCKVDKLKFWNRYGRMVPEVLKIDKASASENLKLAVLKGMEAFVTFVISIKNDYDLSVF